MTDTLERIAPPQPLSAASTITSHVDLTDEIAAHDGDVVAAIRASSSAIEAVTFTKAADARTRLVDALALVRAATADLDDAADLRAAHAALLAGNHFIWPAAASPVRLAKREGDVYVHDVLNDLETYRL